LVANSLVSLQTTLAVEAHQEEEEFLLEQQALNNEKALI
jgi:hypothetical protein